MKIYISNILPKNLSNNFDEKIINTLGKNNVYYEKNVYTELVSKELGIFIINTDQSIKHLQPNYSPKFEQLTNYNNTGKNLVFDLTEYNYNLVVSRLPTEYIYLRIIETSYKLTKISKLTLKIKYIEELDEHFIRHLVPIDYYFEYDESNIAINELLSNVFFQQDFNMFLSVLN
jgi:hypothetical protein